MTTGPQGEKKLPVWIAFPLALAMFGFVGLKNLSISAMNGNRGAVIFSIVAVVAVALIATIYYYYGPARRPGGSRRRGFFRNRSERIRPLDD